MKKTIVPLQASDLAEPADLVAAIRARRGGELINLDRMLLHSVPFARGWNRFLGEVRENLTLDPKLRELAMSGVAVLNRADYEFLHHAPIFMKCGGSAAQTAALQQLGQAPLPQGLFSTQEEQVIELIVQMTRQIEVGDELLESLQRQLGNTVLVELVGVIATYNMVSRFLVALRVTPDSH